MKTCKHCKAEVPADAKKCKHCTGDLRNWFVRHWIITGFIIVMFIGAVAGSGGNKQNGSSSRKTDTADTETAAIKITATQLASEYTANEISADSKYKDKILEVSGTVSNVGIILGSPYVTLKTNEILSDIQCMLKDSEQSKAGNLQKGQKVVVKGKGGGKSLNIALNNCSIE